MRGWLTAGNGVLRENAQSPARGRGGEVVGKLSFAGPQIPDRIQCRRKLSLRCFTQDFVM